MDTKDYFKGKSAAHVAIMVRVASRFVGWGA